MKRPSLSEVQTALPDSQVERYGPAEEDVSPIVASPKSVEELAAIMTVASDRGWRVAPIGNGGWVGEDVLDVAELIVSTAKLNQIARYEPADLTVTVGAGMEVGALNDIAGRNGQRVALDPPGSSGGTIGALLSAGRSGSLRTGYGRPRDQVLGATVVTGDGRVLKLGGGVVKNVAGFDLLRLIVGSGGTLGIIASATLRLFPIEEAEQTLVFSYQSWTEALKAGRDLARSPLELTAAEMIEERDTGGEPNSRFQLAVRLMGRKEVVEETAKSCEELLHAGRRSEGAEETQAGVWSRMEATEVQAELSVRLLALPSRLQDLFELSTDKLGPGWWRIAQLRTGELRLGRTNPGPRTNLDPGTNLDFSVDDLRLSLTELRHAVEALGGTLTLVNGPTGLRQVFSSHGDMGSLGPLMHGVRLEFDPNEILIDRSAPVQPLSEKSVR